jgi:hypothetical protein
VFQVPQTDRECERSNAPARDSIQALRVSYALECSTQPKRPFRAMQRDSRPGRGLSAARGVRRGAELRGGYFVATVAALNLTDGSMAWSWSTPDSNFDTIIGDMIVTNNLLSRLRGSGGTRSIPASPLSGCSVTCFPPTCRRPGASGFCRGHALALRPPRQNVPQCGKISVQTFVN